MMICDCGGAAALLLVSVPQLGQHAAFSWSFTPHPEQNICDFPFLMSYTFRTTEVLPDTSPTASIV